MNKIIKEYDKIILDLFVLMIVILIYLVLCRQWVFAVVFGLLVLGSHLEVNRKIKEIKKTLE